MYRIPLFFALWVLIGCTMSFPEETDFEHTDTPREGPGVEDDDGGGAIEILEEDVAPGAEADPQIGDPDLPELPGDEEVGGGPPILKPIVGIAPKEIGIAAP